MLKLILFIGFSALISAKHPCKRIHKKVGCYWEDKSGTLLFNDRDIIDWGNYGDFLAQLSCKCNEAAKSGGFKYFAIRFYGICIGLSKRPVTSKSFAHCKNGSYKKCELGTNYECAGDQFMSDMVYQIGRDGGYSDWSDYGTCSVTCGKGVSTRTRKCDNPTPIANGDKCDKLGPAVETTECKKKACIVPVDGGFGAWSDYSKCSKSCGGGEQSRERKCDNPAPANGGKDCVGETRETRKCGTKPCPVDGGFGAWGDYGKCSVTCGGGIQFRTRKCDDPVPQHGGKDCVGSASKSRVCGDKECPVDGRYGEWSKYSACSKTCGIGTQAKHRECNNPKPSGGGKDCKYGPRQTSFKSCNSGPCAVDGKFGEWTVWTVCSKTCGGGAQKRSRECNNPPPSGGGKDCIGDSIQTQGCANDFCKGPTGVSKAQDIVETFLEKFHKTEYPDKKPSGKFYKAIFAIQKAVAEEFISVDPSVRGKTLEERLKDLEKFLKAATEGGSIDFARTTLGKGLFTFMKQKVKEGLPIDDIDSAAKGYLDKLRGDIGDDKMNEILSSQGDSTLMFTMDTTGSMAQEIAAAKAIAKQIIDSTRDFKVDYILSPFNDPSSGPVTYRNEDNRASFVSDIDRLKAHGGGDCPELAFKGMLNAINKGPRYGSPMFVFTDASPKDADASNMASLKAAAEMNDATITFFTNLQGCTSGAKRGIDDYKEIASYTGGQVFPLKNEAELLKFSEFVKSSLQQDTLIASGGTLSGRMKRSASFTHGFIVDDGIAKIIVSVAVSRTNTASLVALNDPSNTKATPSTVMSMSEIFEIANPKPGAWKLIFPNSVGKYEYSVQAISDGAIEFAHSFMYQQSVRKNSPPFSMTHPFKGEKNMIVVRLGGIDRMDLSSLKLHIVDIHGKVLQGDIHTDRLDSDDMRNATIIPPNEPFKVKLTGKTKTGFNFERISRGVSRATTAYLRATFAGNDFTATMGKGSVNVQIQCINKGPEENFEFLAKATYGSISNPSQRKSIRTMGFLSFTYTPPYHADKKGKADRIVVTAKRPSNGESFNQHVSILLVM